MNVAGIILAAGRGSRMKELTEDKPKCLVELSGQALLHWQLSDMRSAGIERILVVTGYKKEKILGNFATTSNENWQNTNMLSSLLCAEDFASNCFANGIDKLIISYSDILYHRGHIQKLISAKGHIAIAYDTLWAELWDLRFGEKALEDAETFRHDKGRLLEIGGKSKILAEIQGQYMGLLAFDKSGWKSLVNAARTLGAKTANMDMTAFLQHLLNNNHDIEAVPVSGKWCEVDSSEDLNKYAQKLATGSWSHDWR